MGYTEPPPSRRWSVGYITLQYVIPAVAELLLCGTYIFHSNAKVQYVSYDNSRKTQVFLCGLQRGILSALAHWDCLLLFKTGTRILKTLLEITLTALAQGT